MSRTVSGGQVGSSVCFAGEGEKRCLGQNTDHDVVEGNLHRVLTGGGGWVERAGTGWLVSEMLIPVSTWSTRHAVKGL